MTARHALIEAVLLALAIDKGRGTTKVSWPTDDGREVTVTIRPIRKSRKDKDGERHVGTDARRKV